jgi:uncharacterized protein YciI
MPIFAVIRRRTERWDRNSPLEGQQAWREHADFMNALEEEGFALLAGPLEDGRDEVLLILNAPNAERIEARLAGDPWTGMGLLETVRVTPWTLRLGALD